MHVQGPADQLRDHVRGRVEHVLVGGRAADGLGLLVHGAFVRRTGAIVHLRTGAAIRGRSRGR